MNLKLTLGLISALVEGFETVAPIVIHNPKTQQLAGVIISDVETAAQIVAEMFGKGSTAAASTSTTAATANPIQPATT